MSKKENNKDNKKKEFIFINCTYRNITNNYSNVWFIYDK